MEIFLSTCFREWRQLNADQRGQRYHDGNIIFQQDRVISIMQLSSSV